MFVINRVDNQSVKVLFKLYRRKKKKQNKLVRKIRLSVFMNVKVNLFKD